MPLPDEYFNILSQGADSGIQTFPGMNLSVDAFGRPIYPEVEEPFDPGYGGVGDLATSAFEGFVSGMSWGVIDLQEKDWDNMNTMERTGWVLGEGASLFAPYGPFSLIGKGGRALTRSMGNKFVGEVVETAAGKQVFSSDKAVQLLAGAKDVASKTGKGIDEVIGGLSDDVQRGLKEILNDDTALRWVNDATVAGDHMDQALKGLHAVSNAAVGKAFKEVGMDVVPSQTAFISRKFVDELLTGGPGGSSRYVNDVAEWIERGLGTRLPSGVSKYLGMAAQDMAMMSIHSAGAGKIAEVVHGEEFDLGTALSHSAIMSLAFPAIRLIPNIKGMGSAGHESIVKGIKSYATTFRKTDYNKFVTKYGEDTARDLLKVMIKGGKKDLINKSRINSSWWKVGGVDYTPDELLYTGKIDKMPIADVKELLGKFQKDISGSIAANWGPRYLADLFGSSPRMTIGVLAMNEGIFRTGAFNHMDGEELAAHIFMAGIMTKGQGAWGRDASRRQFANMTPYYDALSLLRARPDVIKDRLKFHEDLDDAMFIGASFASDPLGQQIEQVYDKGLEGRKGTHKSSEFSVDTHEKVLHFGEIYNLIKVMRGADAIDIKKIGKKRLDNIATQLDNIEVESGVKIGDISWEAAQARYLTNRPAMGIHKLYGLMFNELNQKLGLPVSYSEGEEGQYGRIGYQRVYSGEGLKNDMGMLMGYNNALDRMRSINGSATVRTDQRISLKDLLKDKDMTLDEFNVEFKKITDKWMDQIDSEYGNRKMYESIEDNIYLTFLGRAGEITAKDYIYSVMVGDRQHVDAGNLSTSLDEMFLVTDMGDNQGKLKYRKNITEYKIETKNEEQEIAASEYLEMLRPIFNMKRRSKVGTAQTPGKSKEIKYEQLETAAKTFMEQFNKLPDHVKSNFNNIASSQFLKRSLGSMASNRRLLHAAQIVEQEGIGIWNPDDMRLHIIGIEGVRQMSEFKELSPDGKRKIEKAIKNIEAAFPDLVVRDPFFPTETKDPNFHNFTLDSIIKVEKALGDSKIVDLLTDTKDRLDGVRFKDDALQSRLAQIQMNVEKSLDNITTLGKGDVEILRKTAKDVNDLLELGVPETDVAKLDEGLSRLKMFLSKGDKFEIDKYSESVKSIGETIKDIFAREVVAKEEMATVVNNIIDLTTQGTAGGGLKTHSSIEAIELLSNKLRELIKTQKKDKSVPLSDVIEQYNEHGSWIKARSIIEAVNEKVVTEVLKHSDNPLFSQRAKEIWDASSKIRNINEPHKSLQTIIQKYGLFDKDNPTEVRPDFIDTMTNINDTKSVYHAVQEVRKFIFDNSKSPAEASKKWKKFKDEELGYLANAILNSNLRTAATLKAGMLVIDNELKFRITPNDDFFSRKHTFQNDGEYKNIVYLNDTITVDSPWGYGHRNVSLDQWDKAGEPTATIQNAIDKSLRQNVLTEQVWQRLSEAGFKFTQNRLKDMGTVPFSPFVYMRLSPGTRILFEASIDNVKKLNRDFETWYNEKLTFLGREQLDPSVSVERQVSQFENLFKGLLKDGDTNGSLQLKMLATHVDFTRRGQFHDWLVEYSRSGDKDPQKLSKIESNLYKRGYLSDGGTATREHPKLRDYLKNHHSDSSVKAQADKIDQNHGKIDVGVIKDEFGQGGEYGATDSPFDIRRIVADNLIDRSGTASNPVEKSIIESVLKKLYDNTYDSLDNSVLDGAKIASASYMKYLLAQKGSTQEFNGAKTIIMATGDSNMLGKGFVAYIPGVSDKMPSNIDLLIGESSAKSFDGVSKEGSFVGKGSGHRIEALELKVPKSQKAGTWADNLASELSDRNTLQIDATSVGVQFTSKNVKGINISSSMFDWQPATHLAEARKWLDINNIIDEISAKQIYSKAHESNELARELFLEKEREGLFHTEGALGLTKKMIIMGMTSSNPMIAPQVGRMLRSSDFSRLKNIKTTGGEENFIIPDFDGSLSSPVIADLYAREGKWLKNKLVSDPTAKWSIENRAVMQFGGMAVGTHTMERPFEDGLTSFERRTFIVRDSNGVDHAVQRIGDEFFFDSPFYDKFRRGTNVLLDGKGSPLGQELADFWSRHDNKNKEIKDKNGNIIQAGFETEIKGFMKDVFDVASRQSLSFGEVFEYITNGYVHLGAGITGRQSKDIKMSQANKDIAKKYNIALGFSNNSIPKIAKDQVTMRVERVNQKMNGLVQVNNHDLRVALQRDNDGDHLYTYMDVPMKMLKDYNADMGMIRDYEMFDKMIDHTNINIFGIGEDGRAGQKVTQVGFTNYARDIAAQRRAIGQIISARRVMHWLDLTNLEYEGESGLSQKLIKNFTSKERYLSSLFSENQPVFSRMKDIFQNIVDVFGGSNPVVRPDILRDFFFWGELPAEYSPDPTKKEAIHSLAGSIFNSKQYGTGTRRLAEREAFNIIQTIMKKANMIANDVWDEGGSRAPEPYELKEAYNNLVRLHSDPNGIILEKLLSKIDRMKRGSKQESAQVNEMTLGVIDMFFQKPKDLRGVTDSERIDKFLSKIHRGKIYRPVKQPWRFNTKGGFDGFMKANMGAYTLNRLMERKVYWEYDAGDLSPGEDGIYHKKAGRIANDLVARVLFSRILNGNPVKAARNGEFKLPSEIMERDDIDPGTVREAVTLGVIKTILDKQYNHTQASLEYFMEERFVNPKKIEKLEHKLGVMRDVIDILDIKAAENMVISKEGDVQMKTKDRKSKKEFFKNKRDTPVFIYELKGPITVRGGKATDDPSLAVSDLIDSHGKRIDYGNLKKKAWLNKNEEFTFFPGNTYILDYKPLVRESLNSMDSMYNEAWKEITGVGKIMSHNLVHPDAREQFTLDTEQLRSSINRSYQKTLDAVKTDRTDRVADFQKGKADQMHLINDYMNNNVDEILAMGHVNNKTEAVMQLIRYVLQPQPLSGRYLYNGTQDLPYYKMNRTLAHKVLQWATEHNHAFSKRGLEKQIERMVKDLEKIAHGENYEIDYKVDDFKGMYQEGYNWDALGKNATLVRNLNTGWFATPLFHTLEGYSSVFPKQYGNPKTARMGPNKVKIKQKITKKFWEADGCVQ